MNTNKPYLLMNVIVRQTFSNQYLSTKHVRKCRTENFTESYAATVFWNYESDEWLFNVKCQIQSYSSITHVNGTFT